MNYEGGQYQFMPINNHYRSNTNYSYYTSNERIWQDVQMKKVFFVRYSKLRKLI